MALPGALMAIVRKVFRAAFEDRCAMVAIAIPVPLAFMRPLPPFMNFATAGPTVFSRADVAPEDWSFACVNLIERNLS
jgi:hypothetical protein